MRASPWERCTLSTGGRSLQALQVNSTISTVRMGHNPLASEGVASLLDAVRSNLNLRELDLTKVPVAEAIRERIGGSLGRAVSHNRAAATVAAPACRACWQRARNQRSAEGLLLQPSFVLS
jgi:hypothetical protein